MGRAQTYFAVDSIQIDEDASFFVGDAAGCMNNFASTDRKWAVNISIPFYTPEVGISAQDVEMRLGYYEVRSCVALGDHFRNLLLYDVLPGGGLGIQSD
ncbi:hypothetical protein DFH29DRAFT_211080 [Suillus ampliporus]|nr:hypothetical protein DFH29DRAFT_211080 [Suillus ampliporus]